MRLPITIGLPTRNRAAMLRASLASALEAAGPADRLLVSDNASEDGTTELLERVADHRVTVLHQPRDLGMVGNWNACLSAAPAGYFLLLSDDDLLERGALEALAAPLGDPRVAFAYGRARVIDEGGSERTRGHLGPVREHGAALVNAWFRSERTLYPCALMFRRDDLRAIGGYMESDGPFADVGAWLGVWAADPGRDVAFVPDVVAAYRVHEAALSTGDLTGGIAGINRLAERFAAACGPFAAAGFARLRSHYVASALGRRARATRAPLLSYFGLLLRHAPRIARLGSLEPYWRQARILADPDGYERAKERLAARAGRTP